MRLVGEAFQKSSREPRFADAGLAREQQHLAFTALRSGPAPQEQFGFFFPSDEGGQTARVHRVEPAFRGTRPQSRPGSRWLGDALEVSEPDIVQLEEIAEKSARAVANNNHIRLGHALQARRKVRCLADDGSLLRVPRADELTDDHKPGHNSDTRL